MVKLHTRTNVEMMTINVICEYTIVNKLIQNLIYGIFICYIATCTLAAPLLVLVYMSSLPLSATAEATGVKGDSGPVAQVIGIICVYLHLLLSLKERQVWKNLS